MLLKEATNLLLLILAVRIQNDGDVERSYLILLSYNIPKIGIKENRTRKPILITLHKCITKISMTFKHIYNS